MPRRVRSSIPRTKKTRHDVTAMSTPWLGLVGWLVATLAAAAAGALSTRNARDFYAALAKPGWAPPGWVFGPVWTTLYLMIAVAAWLVWRDAGWAGAPTALWLWVAQLICNALWSWIFFAWRRGAWAFADVVLLLVLTAATVAAFARVNTLAAVLLLPYLLWIGFATALTYTVWRANLEQLSRH